MEFFLLPLTILVSATLAIIYRQLGRMSEFRFLKPLTSVLIIVHAFLAYPAGPGYFSLLVVAGLIFCLLGDVFLLSERHFVQGLGSFLLAHGLFSWAFSQFWGFYWGWEVLLPLLLFGAGYFYFLKKSLKKYTWPVIFYFAAILFMDWQAIGLALQNPSLPFLAMAIAALLFTFSDACIAYKKFIAAFAWAEVWILSTYWISIFLLATSLHLLRGS